MRHEYEYIPGAPGTRETGLPRFSPALASDGWGMTADGVAALMERKRATIAYNTRQVEKAYVKHQHVLIRFDRLIRSVERLADTPELQRLVLGLRVQRDTAEELLFLGGHELRSDETVQHFAP